MPAFFNSLLNLFELAINLLLMQVDRLLHRHNNAQMEGIDRRIFYNIPNFESYGPTRTASLPLQEPTFHGYGIPRNN